MLSLTNFVQAITQAVSSLQIRSLGKQDVKGRDNQHASQTRFVRKLFLGKLRPLQLSPGTGGSLDTKLVWECCKDIGHLKQIVSAWNKIGEGQAGGQYGLCPIEHSIKQFYKLNTPLSKDPEKGANGNGLPTGNDNIEFFWSISNDGILAQTKVDIMQQAVAKYPRIKTFLRV